MRKLFFICLLVFFLPAPAFCAEWVKFDLEPRPYFDPDTGDIVNRVKIAVRSNARKGDRFSGGGKIYPDLSTYSILAWHEKDLQLILQLGIDDNTAAALVAKTDKCHVYLAYRIRKSRKRTVYHPTLEREYNFNEFKPTRLSETEAKTILIGWGRIEAPKEPGSGVTN